MKLTRSALLVSLPTLLAALLALAAAAPAPADAAALHPGIALFGGFQEYGMRDVNQAIDQGNNRFSGTLGTSAFALREIQQGFGYGGGVRFDARKDVVVSLDVTRLAASTSDSWPGVGSAEWKLPGTAITGTCTYFFPSDSRIRYGLGVGLGYYHCSGSIVVDMPGTQQDSNVTGNGIGFHGMGTLDAAIASAMHLEISFGLRYARTSNLEANGQELLKSDGGKLRADWSGAMTRGGLTFYFGKE